MKVLQRLFSFLKLLFAGLIIFASMLFSVWVITSIYGDKNWPQWAVLAPIFAMIFTTFLLLYIHNRRSFLYARSQQSTVQQLAELEVAGQIGRGNFQAKRAIFIDEFEDEGISYFIELDNGRTLFLSGQYLYDYEPTLESRESSQPRKFPCTEFELLYNRVTHENLGIDCKGLSLNPEAFCAPFSREDFENQLIPEDGQIILDKCFDDIKQERLAASNGMVR
jgi:hypothetical protein